MKTGTKIGILGVFAIGVLALLEKEYPGINSDHPEFDQDKNKKEILHESADSLKIDSVATKQVNELKP